MRKGISPYEYISSDLYFSPYDWEKINEILPEKEDFDSHLNMGDITDIDYAHLKKIDKDLEVKNLGEYHELYVQRDTLAFINVFEDFQNMYLEM